MINIINKKNNNNIHVLLLVIVVIIFIIINLILYSKFVLQPKAQQKNQGIVTATQKEENASQVAVARTDEEIIKMLSTYGERDRMEYYCGEYFKHLDKQEYESAYNLLYSEFKETYFPTLEKYVEYVKKTYPSECGLSYDDITRQGDIYVLDIRIFDVLGSRESEKTQRIVVKENNYNNYYISFQVI